MTALRDLRVNTVPTSQVSTALSRRELSTVETRFTGTLFSCKSLTRNIGKLAHITITSTTWRKSADH
jgi:hypothetical protein